MKSYNFDLAMDTIISISTYAGILSALLIKTFQYSGNLICSDLFSFLPLSLPFIALGGTIAATSVKNNLDEKKMALEMKKEEEARQLSKDKSLDKEYLLKRYLAEQEYLKSFRTNNYIEYLRKERENLLPIPNFDSENAVLQKTLN